MKALEKHKHKSSGFGSKIYALFIGIFNCHGPQREHDLHFFLVVSYDGEVLQKLEGHQNGCI